jgi:hypothetical protein
MELNNAIQPKSFAPAPRYEKQPKWAKLKRKINSIIIGRINGTPLQFSLYKSYWHYRFSPKTNEVQDAAIANTHYLTQVPNYGAGIGHQLANWNAGLYFADFYKIKFAHSPFSTAQWENFLGFGEGEVLASDLERDKKFIKVRLPRFDSLNLAQVALIGKIISSYKQPGVLFYLEMDQGYMRQWSTYHVLSDKFFRAAARKNDELIYDPDKFNIAIHIRRRMKIETEEVWKERGLYNSYYANILTETLALIRDKQQVEIYLFSQGLIEDFPEFANFDNIHYCMDMGPVDSVLHMVNADLLISSKSSFSYKPALISKNIQICPQTFWHNYPSATNYILADNSGVFDKNKLLNQLSRTSKLKQPSQI